ncbi:hypothetical protein HDV05_002833 [Chytridiales sp. JEL 0842]|nr:hypothetical protein HDV05_002833 [Chytridiales sp. JEL 0842]
MQDLVDSLAEVEAGRAVPARDRVERDDDAMSVNNDDILADENVDIYAKVRQQVNSGLENQRRVAMLLNAVEATIKEQKEQCSPLAYFGALMTLLEQQNSHSNSKDAEGIAVAASSLLAIVFPRIPSNILRLKLSVIATTLTGSIKTFHTAAALVRDLTLCVEVILQAQDLTTWTNATSTNIAENSRASEVRSLFLLLLILSMDQRPKVRRRAQEGLKKLLSRPPPPSTHHPAAVPAIDYCINQISEFASSTDMKARDRESQILHVLVFLKSILPVLAMQGAHEKTLVKIRTLCELLLKLPVKTSGTGNTVMTQWVFQVLDSLFNAPQHAGNVNELFAHLDVSLVDSVLRSLLTLRPYQNDVTLGPAWLDLVSHGFVSLSTLLKSDTDRSVVEAAFVDQYKSTTFPELLGAFWLTSYKAMLGQDTKKLIIDKAASMFFALITECITDEMVQTAVGSLRSAEGSDDPVLQIIELINFSITNVHYRDSWGAILRIAEGAMFRLGVDAPGLVDGLLTSLIEHRDAPSFSDDFPFKEELESALEAAAQSMGLERFSITIPLNIFDVTEDDKRRPYLLTTFQKALERPAFNKSALFGPANLVYFTETLYPLYNRLRDRSDQLKAQGHLHASKLFETLARQAFALFPAICSTVASDLAECFDQLAPQLGKLLQADSGVYEIDPETGLPVKEDVRPLIYSGLESLVLGYSEIVATLDPENLEHQELLELATAGLSRLKASANKFLSVFCNTYTTISPNLLSTANHKAGVLQQLHERGNLALERCITSFLNVAEGRSVTSYFFNLVKNLLKIQNEQSEETDENMDEEEDAVKKELLRLRTYAILDLLCILLPFLPEVRSLEDWDPNSRETAPEIPSSSPLHMFYKVLINQLNDEDGSFQKKTYKALNLVVSALTPSNQVPLKELMDRLIDPEVLQTTTSGAKKPRMKLIQLAVEGVPADKEEEGKELLIDFVPVALSEVMLTTKEASEKARNAAFDCLIAIGRRMHVIGQKVSKKREWERTRKALASGKDADGMDADEDEREISLREFLMMVTAGLAGSTANMQSASIACLSRIIFEFNEMETDVVKEVVKTVLLFISSPNREIIKAALGFVKVAIVTLKQEYLEDDLETLIPSIVNISRDHKSHFRSKVRHILERIIRRFSYEAVEGFIPDTDRKLIVNIRKRRDRIKKQKAAARQQKAEDGDSDDEVDAKKAVLQNKQKMQSRQKEFDDAIHGSESELEDSDDDEDQYIPDQFKDALSRKPKKAAPGTTQIREDDEVLDFLDPTIVSRVTTKANVQKKNSKGKAAASAFEVNEDGRLVFEDEDENGKQNSAPQPSGASAEDYYRESLTGEGAFQRLPDGRIKFLNKRKRDEDEVMEEGSDEESKPVAGSRFGIRKPKKATGMDDSTKNRMLGRQFKAKKAKGDVKKAGMPDPFAYIPLSGKIVGSRKKSTQLTKDYKDVLKSAVTGRDASQKAGSARTGKGVNKANKRHK